MKRPADDPDLQVALERYREAMAQALRAASKSVFLVREPGDPFLWTLRDLR